MRPRAAIVVTGSELVRGARRDANGPYLASRVLELGLDPIGVHIVGDGIVELRAALGTGLEADLLVTSGGLGPTHDDRTIAVLADVVGRSLIVDDELVTEIGGVSKRAAERLGRSYTDFEAGVVKQATLPEGGESLGLAGTAPGVLLEHAGSVVIALPGPPSELQRLWENASAHPAVLRLAGAAPARSHRVLRFFGPSESAVAHLLGEAGGETDGVEVTVCARNLEIHVDLYIDDAAREHGKELEAALVESFGERLFARDDSTVQDILLELCRQRDWTLATAESCTGGLVGAVLTQPPGASAVYVGGSVAYANQVKVHALDVPPELLGRHGAVSAETAAAMASGIRDRLRADVGLAVTGIAGPGGGTSDKPVGLVFVHVSTPDHERGRRLEIPGDREAIRQRATASLLHLARQTIAATGAEAE
jgi:nicotinamide-nucleotide amidase